MAVSNSYKELIADLLAPVGVIAIRRMFGGAGVTAGGVTFAILADDTLYFKVDDTTRAKYEAEQMAPFTYTSKSGTHALSSYWRCPDRLFDELDEMHTWAREALRIARHAANAAPAKPKTATKKPKTAAKKAKTAVKKAKTGNEEPAKTPKPKKAT